MVRGSCTRIARGGARVVAGAAAMAMLLSACSGGSDDAGSSGTKAGATTTSSSRPASSTPKAVPRDRCSLLSKADVRAATGRTPDKVETGEYNNADACFWEGGSTPLVTLRVMTDPAKATKEYNATRNYDGTTRDVPPIGTAPVWGATSGAYGTSLTFFQGATLVALQIRNPTGKDQLPAAELEALRRKLLTLGRTVAPKLPPATTSKTAPKAECSLLSKADVRAATGSAPGAVKREGDGSGCSWLDGTTKVATLRVVTDPAEANKTYNEEWEAPGPDAPRSSIGTAPSWRPVSGHLGPQLMFFKGTTLVRVVTEIPLSERNPSPAQVNTLHKKTLALGRMVADKLP